MGWGQTTRVLLVWPRKGELLHRRLDLTLIKRHSVALGSQLALVTRDRDVRYQADRLEIPVYKSVREAELNRWRRPRKRRKNTQFTSFHDNHTKEREKLDLAALREQAHPMPSRWLLHPVVRIGFFTLGVLSMLVVAAIFIPSAEIFVSPASKTETITIDVLASPDHNTVELSGAVPAYVESVVVEGREKTAASGETLIPKQTATGRVSFVNLTEEEISIPIGSVVSTQDETPIRFITTRDVIIPTGTEGATVPIEAIQSGSIGNVSAGTIVAIEGWLGLNLSVTNRRGTAGGSDFEANTPNKDDYQKAYNQLFISLLETALSEFEFNSAPGDVALSPIPIHQQALEVNSTPEIGEPADFLELSLRAEFQFTYSDEADLHQLGRIVLDRHISEDYTPRPETLQITQLTKPVNQTSGKTAWRMQASWQMGANLNETEAVSLILGQRPEQALQQLNDQTPVERGTEIRLTPEWWPFLPVFPFRIKIINLLETAPTESLSSSLLLNGVGNKLSP